MRRRKFIHLWQLLPQRNPKIPKIGGSNVILRSAFKVEISCHSLLSELTFLRALKFPLRQFLVRACLENRVLLFSRTDNLRNYLCTQQFSLACLGARSGYQRAWIGSTDSQNRFHPPPQGWLRVAQSLLRLRRQQLRFHTKLGTHRFL